METSGFVAGCQTSFAWRAEIGLRDCDRWQTGTGSLL
jgi:hypothetical protein